MLAWISRLFSLITHAILVWVNGLSDDQRWATLFQQQYEDRQLMGALLGDVMNVCPEYWDIRAVLEDSETGLVPLAQRIATVEGKIDTLLARPAGTVGEPSNANTQNLTDVATEVWTYHLPDGVHASDHLRWAGANGWEGLQSAFHFPGAPDFKIKFYTTPPAGWYSFGNPPLPDWTDIRPEDTRLSWLQRTELAHTWHQTEYEATPTATLHTYDFSLLYLDLTEVEFNLLKSVGGAGLEPAVTGYPGPGLVTWGTPLAFDDHAKVDAATYGVDGRMDGILVLITATPPTLGSQEVEDVHNYFRLGWLVFEDEEANTDRLQWFGPDRAVYVPQAFASPANVVVSCKPGVSGTITPWVVT